MTRIRLVEVSKHYGRTVAVDRVSLTVESGELFFLLGPSGCGKTTLLRMLAGFVEPDRGEIYFDEQCMNGVPPQRRDTGMVFQSFALWPHRTVAGNVAYGLEVRGLGRALREHKLQEALRLVRLEGLAARRPAQLSGGQQQRVALARALVIEPRVLLLDEPLANLDARLRDELRGEILRIQRQTQVTTVYVTHDQKEALAVADRIGLLYGGRLVQVGPPRELYLRPATRQVAQFLGDCNLLTGQLVEIEDPSHGERQGRRCAVRTACGPVRGVTWCDSLEPGDSVCVVVRPEFVRLHESGAHDNCFVARVEETHFLGEVVRIVARTDSFLWQCLALGCDGPKPSSSVQLTFAAGQCVVLPAGDGV